MAREISKSMDGSPMTRGSLFYCSSQRAAEARSTRRVLRRFWESPGEILNPERVRESPNQSVRELASILQDRLREGFSISQVFARRGGFEPAAANFARSKSSVERAFTLSDGTRLVSQCTLELVAEKDVARLLDEFRSGFRSPATDVEIIIDESLQYEFVVDEAKSLRATVPATELVRIFRTPGMGFRLFSLNPRGPLASAKVNKNISRTLDSADGRKTFHLRNNGLCATCDDFSLRKGD
jgi:AIPR protein